MIRKHSWCLFVCFSQSLRWNCSLTYKFSLVAEKWGSCMAGGFQAGVDWAKALKLRCCHAIFDIVTLETCPVRQFLVNISKSSGLCVSLNCIYGPNSFCSKSSFLLGARWQQSVCLVGRLSHSFTNMPPKHSVPLKVLTWWASSHRWRCRLRHLLKLFHIDQIYIQHWSKISCSVIVLELRMWSLLTFVNDLDLLCRNCTMKS